MVKLEQLLENKILIGKKDSLGSCHLAWEIQKRLLMECYGIEWHSPSELNSHIDFD